MFRKNPLTDDEELALVQRVLEHEQDRPGALAARAVLLASSGWSVLRIAAELREPTPVIRKWIRAFGAERSGKRGASRAAVAAVVRLIQGERVDVLAEELGVPAAEIVSWRDEFFRAGHKSLERWCQTK